MKGWSSVQLIHYTQKVKKKDEIKLIPNQILFEMNTDGHQRSVSNALLKFRIKFFFLLYIFLTLHQPPIFVWMSK